MTRQLRLESTLLAQLRSLHSAQFGSARQKSAVFIRNRPPCAGEHNCSLARAHEVATARMSRPTAFMPGRMHERSRAKSARDARLRFA